MSGTITGNQPKRCTRFNAQTGRRLDVDAEHARFEKEGLSPRKLVEFERDGSLLAKFFFVQDPDGYEIEVLQRHGRFK